MRSLRRPQNRNRVPASNGLRLYLSPTILASPSIPFRKSVVPHYPDIGIMWIMLMIFLSSSFARRLKLQDSMGKIMRIKK